MTDHYTSINPLDMQKAYINARKLRAAYIQRFFAKLFAKKPVTADHGSFGQHAAA